MRNFKLSFLRPMAIHTSYFFIVLGGVLPLLFNSCVKKDAGQEDLSALYCPKSFKSEQTPTQGKLTHSRINSPFALNKLHISTHKVSYKKQGKLQSTEQSQKLTSGDLVPKGKAMTVLVDNTCVNPDKDRLSTQLASSYDSPLKKDAYTYILEQDMSFDALDKLIGEDPCIIGASDFILYESQAIYDDPDQNLQTHMIKNYARQSHDIFYDSAKGIKSNQNVVVAVIDSGVDYTHRDLNDNMWSNSQGKFGYNAGRDQTMASCYPSGVLPAADDPIDTSPIFHGTHVAGIVAAETNNAVGIAGHAPANVQLMAINVFYYWMKDGSCVKDTDSGDGIFISSSTVVARGMQYAIENGADVLNLSLGSQIAASDDDPLYIEQIESALNAGITVVTVSGNGVNGVAQHLNTTNYMIVPAKYGASYNGVITVGSVDTANSYLSRFSNYSNTYTEITAYGNTSYDNGGTPFGIYSTLSNPPFGTYGYLAGTSMAAPQVAAAAAMAIGMMRSHDLDPQPAVVEDLIWESAIENPNMLDYVKGGKILNFQNLALRMQTCFPDTTLEH